MQNSQYIQGDMDFKQSRISQYSKYDFDVKSQPFQVDESIDKSIIDRCVSQKQFVNTPQVNKKLYLNDLQTHKEKSNDSKFSSKQNNISVTHHNQPQSYTQSRKIVLQRNPYKNSAVDESFTTNKIVQLQQELLEVRKQLSMKQSSWIKEKSILLNKIQIAQYDLAEIKQRNNNLIQINQTLTQALGETSKHSSSNQNDKRIEQLNREIQLKNRKIQNVEDALSRSQKDKIDLQSKLKQERQKNQSLTKNLEQYKTILKQSNQRKFQSDEKIMVMNKNIDIVKKKITQLPIKESYLHPIFAFLESMKSIHFQNHTTQESSYLEISDVKKPRQDRSFIGHQKNNYRQQDSYVQIKPNCYGLGNQNSYLHQNSGYYENNQSYGERQNQYVESNKNTSNFTKPQKSNSRINLFSRQVKRIDTQENQQDESHTGQYQEEEEVYLCEICQRVYPNEQFMGHLQECQQYQALLKQKKAIESKLISIKQQEYDNRKSNTNSLNNSVIMMNKSKSKGKFIRPSQNGHRVDKGYDRQSNSRKISNIGNKTERFQHQDFNDGSRLELSELMNISEISNRHSDLNQKGNDKKVKKNLINASNYFSNGVQNQQNFNYPYNQENLNYKIKPSPQIKYQTHIPQQQNNIGKQSMQQEIRRIVQAMNEGRKSVSKQHGGFQKINNKQHIGENRSLTSRNNAQKNDRRESQLGGRNYDRSSRNKADFY